MIGIKDSKDPGRNTLCPCGSKLKYKYCHGDGSKRAVCNRVANEKMVQLIEQEQIRKGLRCRHGVVNTEHCKECAIEG